MPAPIRMANAVIDFSPVAALATGVTENVDFTCIRPFDLYEATVLPTATAAVSGSAQVSRQALGTGGFNTVTNAMTMTTSGTVARTTTITVAQRQCVATDVIRCIFIDGGGGGGANGHCYLNVLATPIAGNT